MDAQGVFQVAGAILLSVGGAGVVLWALSSWLGKVWAERILAAERERFRSETESELAKLRSELDLERRRAEQEYLDKLAIYRSVADLVAAMVAAFTATRMGAQMTAENWLEFERQRLKTYGYLAMVAPQEVMDAFDALIDYMLDVGDNTEEYDFLRIRELGIEMLNRIRVDIAQDANPIVYRGRR